MKTLFIFRPKPVNTRNRIRARPNVNSNNQVIFVSPECCVVHSLITRMKTFIKDKINKSDDQTSIDNYRVAAIITEYHHYILKLIFLRIIFPKFMMVRQ